MAGLLFCGFATVITSCVDNDDNVPENYYSSTKLTAAQFLEERPEQFSEFIALLKRTPYFSMLSTYGTYSVRTYQRWCGQLSEAYGLCQHL